MEQAPRRDQQLETFLARVRALPTIEADDIRVTDPEQRTRLFGNNFYMLWLHIQPDYELGSIMRQLMQKRIDKYPAWSGFLEDNNLLIDQISLSTNEVLLPYLEVFHDWLDVLNTTPAQERKAFILSINACTGHPLGFEAAAEYVHDQMNPLFEQAAEHMRAAGIVPEDFFV